MKGLVDKSMGIVTHIGETLPRIKPTDPLRLDKRKQSFKVLIDTTRSAYGDRQEHNGIRSIHVYLTIMPNLHSGCLVEGTIRLRTTGGR
jgi:hypothetical protein